MIDTIYDNWFLENYGPKSIFKKFSESLDPEEAYFNIEEIKRRFVPEYSEELIQLFFPFLLEIKTYDESLLNKELVSLKNNWYYFTSSRLSGLKINVTSDYEFYIKNNQQIILEKLMFKLHLSGYKGFNLYTYLTIYEDHINVKISDYDVGFDGTNESIIIHFKNTIKVLEISKVILKGLISD